MADVFCMIRTAKHNLVRPVVFAADSNAAGGNYTSPLPQDVLPTLVIVRCTAKLFVTTMAPQSK